MGVRCVSIRACAALILSAMLLGMVPAVSAQTADVQALRQEIEQLRKEFEAIQQEYTDRLNALEASLAASVPAPAPAGADGSLPVYSGATATSKIFNPDIGVIGNFISASGESRGGSESIAPLPFATLQETELSLQAIVDPYARADFFLALGEEGIEVEEGYVTFPTLPGGLLVKVGKFRANLGRLNAFHNHSLPWIDRPLVMFNLLGGSPLEPDTGIKDAGVSVSRLIPAGNLFLEATGEVFRGESGAVFEPSRRSDVSAVGRLRAYADFTEDTNIEIGGSYARGHNGSGVIDDVDVGRFTTDLWAADATVRWRPLRQTAYRSFVGRSEFVWSRRDQPGGLQSAFGYYLSGEYQLARRWFIGGRYDWSERADDATARDWGNSAVLTFWPSEFTQIRGQYRRTRYGDDRRMANELLLQALFTIGAHGAHPF
jgi:hypothetical protein